MELTAGLVCDRGLNPKRPVNQDSYLLLPEYGLFGVFDGVGGQRAGEVASQTAAETIQETVTHSTLPSAQDLIRSALQFANRDIVELAESEPSYKTMATTAALLFVRNGDAVVAHVGDSRVYRIRDGRAIRETIDHTENGDLVRSGAMTARQADDSADNHMINRALGAGPTVEAEIKAIRLNGGERLLLCTDGIYRHLEDDEIAKIVSNNAEPQAAADELKQVVCERGAEDNLTALVIQVGGTVQTPASSKRRSRMVDTMPANKRIQVDITRAESRDSAGGAGDEVRPRKRIWLYILGVLVLVSGSFYAGLRASDLAARKKLSAEDAANPIKPARRLLEQGQALAAEAALKRVVENDPKNSEGFYWMGRAQLQQGQFEAAARSFEASINLKADFPDAYAQAAAAYSADGKRDKAELMLRRYSDAVQKRLPSPTQ